MSLLTTEVAERKRVETELRAQIDAANKEIEDLKGGAAPAATAEGAAEGDAPADGEAAAAAPAFVVSIALHDPARSGRTCSDELAKAQEEIANLNAIREKLENDMAALQVPCLLCIAFLVAQVCT